MAATTYGADNRGPNFRAFLVVMLVVMLVALALRFASRSMLPKSARNTQNARFGWDDFFALAAAVVQTTLLGMELSMIERGFGQHITTLPMDNILFLSKMNWAGNFVYDLSLTLSKLAALFFLARVFPRNTNSRRFNYVLWTAFGLVIAWLIGAIIGTFLFCQPLSKNWDPTEPGECGTQFNLLTGSAVPSVVIDLLIVILPLPKLWHLKISKSRKAGLMVVFILGYSVIVVSIGRLVTVVTSLDAITDDFTYELVPAFYWVSAEVPVTILSISLPAMLPLGRHLSAHYFSPFASKVSLLVSTRNRTPRGSKKGSQSANEGWSEYRDGIRLRSNDGTADFAERPSGDSRRIILDEPRETYSARILSSQNPANGSDRVPDDAIRVDNLISINRR